MLPDEATGMTASLQLSFPHAVSGNPFRFKYPSFGWKGQLGFPITPLGNDGAEVVLE